jgi:hypothetical protein
MHESAYDFARFSYRGHRRLLSGFEEIQGGFVAGPGTALVWALESLTVAFLASNLSRQSAAACVRLAFFWIECCDYLLAKKPEALDGASYTYFFGRKLVGRISDKQVVSGHVGTKHVRHL